MVSTARFLFDKYKTGVAFLEQNDGYLVFVVKEYTLFKVAAKINRFPICASLFTKRAPPAQIFNHMLFMNFCFLHIKKNRNYQSVLKKIKRKKLTNNSLISRGTVWKFYLLSGYLKMNLNMIRDLRFSTLRLVS